LRRNCFRLGGTGSARFAVAILTFFATVAPILLSRLLSFSLLVTTARLLSTLLRFAAFLSLTWFTRLPLRTTFAFLAAATTFATIPTGSI
jgi:hypothetical protein